MKTAPRIVSAALAIAAVVATPFVTPVKPAEAAEPTDVWVKFHGWGPVAVGVNAIQTPIFVIFNDKNSAGNSGALVITKWCRYFTAQGYKDVAPEVAEVYPNLPPGDSISRRIQCGMYQGQMPMQAKLTVKAANEAAAQINAYNSATVNYPN
jgi:hypothetical protein